MNKFELTRNMECLCGSGKKFKSCCNEYMSLSSFEKISIEIENENYLQAFLFCRAEVTKYMRYVKRHTEFLLVIAPEQGKHLLEIDIRALSELLDMLMYIISKLDIQVSFIDNVDRLGELFYNQNWHDRLRYYKVAWEYIFKNNVDNAKKLLTNLSYEEIRDLDFLQMYLDLMSHELSFSTRLEVIDKLISMETRVAGKLQYYGAKAIQFLLITDLKKAKELVSQAIQIAGENATDISDPYDYLQFGNIYHLGGKLLDIEDLHKKAISFFELILNVDGLSLSGRAGAYCHLGDVFLSLNEIEIALSYYNKCLELEELPLARIFVAEIFYRKADYDASIKVLEEIEYSSISNENKIDLLITYGKNVISTQNAAKVNWVFNELKQLKFDSKYFSDIVNELIINLHELLIKTNSKEKFEPSQVKKILGKLNEYIMLEPNIMGLGLNINKIIGDILIKNKEKK